MLGVGWISVRPLSLGLPELAAHARRTAWLDHRDYNHDDHVLVQRIAARMRMVFDPSGHRGTKNGTGSQ
jgi:hypothetical protein